MRSLGAGQSGANLQLPPAVQEIAHFVFTNAFVDAMRPTLLLPVVLIVLAAAATVFARPTSNQTAVEVLTQQEAVA